MCKGEITKEEFNRMKNDLYYNKFKSFLIYLFSLLLQPCNMTIAEKEAPTRITALKAAKKRVYVNAVYIADSRDFIDDCMRAFQIVIWEKIKIIIGNVACAQYNPLNFMRSSRTMIRSQCSSL